MALPLALIGPLLQLVPGVAKLLGGSKAEKVAEKVVGIAGQVTGLSGQSAVDAVIADPQKALEFQQAVMAQQTEIEKLYLEGVADARRRDIEVRKISGNNFRADFLAIGSLVGLVALIYTLLFVSIPDGPARDVLLLLAGALVAIVKDVFAFEFGSSRGSKQKDALLHKMRDK